jgi:PKD repeat protein
VTATLEAHFLKKEYETVNTCFQYRPSGSTRWRDTPSVAQTASGVYSATVARLDPATEYEFRPTLTYDRGEVTGEVHTLSTRDTIANFAATPVQGVRPLTVTFTAVTGSPATYFWDFGDHTASTIRSPVHTYTDVGHYTVTLTVTTTLESATLSRSDYIRVWEDQAFLPVVLRN